MKKNAPRGMKLAGCFLVLILLLVMPGSAAEPEPNREILDRARSIHEKFFPGLGAEDRAGINGQARKLSLGQADEGDWRSFMALRRQGRAGDPEVLHLHVVVQALALMEREIARREAERERILAEIRDVAAKIRGLSSPPPAWLEKRERLRDQNESLSFRLHIVMDRRSQLIATLSDILKKIGATQEALAQNTK